MPMRQDCKFFESRSYPNGDTVRKCDLDLAPEAPWRCPENCSSYAPRLADVDWRHGSLVTPATPPEPAGLGEDDSIAALLDAAEDIINGAVPGALADLEKERRARRGGRRILGRRKKDPASGSAKGSKRSPKRGPKRGPKQGSSDSIADRLRRRYRDGR